MTRKLKWACAHFKTFWRTEYAGLLPTLGPLRSSSAALRKRKRRPGPLRPTEPPE